MNVLSSLLNFIGNNISDFESRITSLKNDSDNAKRTTTLTVTRVISTTYMTDVQFGRMVSWKKYNMLFFKFNAEFTSTGFNATDFQTIATISGWSALSEVIVSIPKQNDGTKVLTLYVKSNGEVQVYSPSSISGFYRGYVCVPCSV